MNPDPEFLATLKALGIAPEILLPLLMAPPDSGTATAEQEEVPGISDTDFALIADALPPEPRQSGAISNRTVIDALLWLHRNRRAGTQVPAQFGTADAVRKRVERWAVAGAFDRFLAEIDRVGAALPFAAELRKIALDHVRRGQRIRKFRGTGTNPAIQ